MGSHFCRWVEYTFDGAVSVHEAGRQLIFECFRLVWGISVGFWLRSFLRKWSGVFVKDKDLVQANGRPVVFVFSNAPNQTCRRTEIWFSPTLYFEEGCQRTDVERSKEKRV